MKRSWVSSRLSRAGFFSLLRPNAMRFDDTGFAANTAPTYTLYAYDAAANRAATAARVTATTLPAGVVPGDLDGDGHVTLADLRLLLQMLLGQVPVNLTTADLDHDGQVSLADVRVLISLFP